MPLAHLDILGIALADRELIAADSDLNGVAQRRYLAYLYLSTARDSHVHDTAFQGPLTMKFDDSYGVADLYISECLHLIHPSSYASAKMPGMV